MSDIQILNGLVEELAQEKYRHIQRDALVRVLQAHGNPNWATPWGSGKVEAKKDAKPTMYMHECDNCVILSAVSEEHPEAQNYYMELQSLRVTGRTDSVGNTSTILRNILVKAGINVVME